MKNCEDLAYDAEVAIGRERARLRFLVFDMQMLLERELTQADGSKFTHSIWLANDQILFDYMTADPYLLHLERHYSVIQKRSAQVRALEERRRENISGDSWGKRQENIDELLKKINFLSICSRDAEIHLRLREILSDLGVSSFVFSTFNLDADGVASNYRFLVGCSSEWVQIYQHRHWYSIDPYLNYAILNAAPAIGSAIYLSTAGQREMCATARQYGFESSLVIPAHSRANSLIGVLHAANNIKAEDGGEACLLEAQALLRAIAGILLDIRFKMQYQSTVERYGLDKRELAALRFVLAGSPAQEVAANLEISVATVYSMYSRINEKLGTNRINEAARLAQRHDVL